jgi:flagellar hook assembly protein FlgD
VSINIYDLNGRIVDVLYNDQLNYGEHNFVWNASNFSSGIYLLNINAGDKSITTKISLLK